MKSNCLIYALRQYIRHGGYVIIRRSRHLWIPHFLWAPPGGLNEAQIRHFVPNRPTRKAWKVWRALLFRGHVRHCDRAVCRGPACCEKFKQQQERHP